MSPLISIIMSVFNESEVYIFDAIQSCLNQTFCDFEMIIVNDNPQKYSAVDFEKFGIDKRIRLIMNPRNLGLALSMNKAIQCARGEYIARMDSDDISLPLRLEREYQFMEENRFDLVCCWYDFVDENGQKIENRNIIRYGNPEVSYLLPYANTIHHPTILARKKVFSDVGYYRNYPCAQDYDLWLRIYEKGYKIGILPEVLFLYRVRRTNVTSTRRVVQYYTQVYARKLLKERQKKGKDSFTIKDYNNFLKKRRALDEKYVIYVIKALDNKNDRSTFYKIYLMISCAFFRRYYFDAARCRVYRRFMGLCGRKE